MPINVIKFSQFAAGNLANPNYLVGVTSLSGGTNFQIPSINTWDTAGRPVSPAVGTLGYNTDLSQYEYWNGSSWIQFAAGGSGTVGMGSAGQVAYYQNTGTAVVGTNTIPNTVATQGIINGTNATTGNIGEYVTSNLPVASAILLGNNTPTDLTSISLTAGDWDVYGNIYFFSLSLTNPQFRSWTNTAPATSPDASNLTQINYNDITNINTEAAITCPFLRVNTTSTISVYLTGFCFSVSGQSSACGTIFARRVR